VNILGTKCEKKYIFLFLPSLFLCVCVLPWRRNICGVGRLKYVLNDIITTDIFVSGCGRFCGREKKSANFAKGLVWSTIKFYA